MIRQLSSQRNVKDLDCKVRLFQIESRKVLQSAPFQPINDFHSTRTFVFKKYLLEV